jgi:hypothetical protein
MLELLQELRHKVAIGFVGGSDLAKQQEQLGSTGENGWTPSITVLTCQVINLFDYCFAENGLTAYRQGTKLPAQVLSIHFHLVCWLMGWRCRLSLTIWERKSINNSSISVSITSQS